MRFLLAFLFRCLVKVPLFTVLDAHLPLTPFSECLSCVCDMIRLFCLGILSMPHFCSVAESCPALCDPMDCSTPVSSVHGTFQARILSQLPFPSPGALPNPGMEPVSPASLVLAGRFFTTAPSGKPIFSASSLQFLG